MPPEQIEPVRISIHALREEGDLLFLNFGQLSLKFLSTPSARRATVAAVRGRAEEADFYPRPPRGGRRVSTSFSERSPLFLSTPSARRATERERR